MPALIRDQLITAGMPAETADCIVGALGDDFFTAMLGSTLSGETPGLDDPAFTNAIQSCMGG